jgi:hypothetical protein
MVPRSQLPQTESDEIEGLGRESRTRPAACCDGGGNHGHQSAQGQLATHPAAVAARLNPEIHEERCQDVELLLDPVRPGVGVGVELGPRRKIRVGVAHQDPVAESEESTFRGTLAQVAEPGRWNEHRRQNRSGNQRNHQRRDDARQAARVEFADEPQDRPGAAVHERACHHEARNDEEDVDSDEAAGQQCVVEVIGHHRQDGDGAETVDVGAVGNRLDRRHS